MRWLKVLPCVVLAACSSLTDNSRPQKEDVAPLIASSAPELRKAAEQEKLSPPLEVAGPIAANSVSDGPWIICLRSNTPDHSSRPTYSVNFKDGKFISVRPSAVIDNCEAQTFSPLTPPSGKLGLPSR
jgi:hypothetical protein